jgi:FkbM family methyltransferase
MTLARYVAWQAGSRLVREHRHSWIAGSKLVVRNGMTGATGNIYCGLHEYVEMAFFLHALRENDFFLDIGANVGTYTVLATAVCKSRVLAFEPDPSNAARIHQNLEANAVSDRATVYQVALGAREGIAAFTVGKNTQNRIATADDRSVQEVELRTLDSIPGAKNAQFIKLDVEGFEAEVLVGASDLLKSKNLVAIVTEGQQPEVIAALTDAGLVRRYYDPRSRTLLDHPPPDLPASDGLFIRESSQLTERLRTAQARRVHGTLV